MCVRSHVTPATARHARYLRPWNVGVEEKRALAPVKNWVMSAVISLVAPMGSSKLFLVADSYVLQSVKGMFCLVSGRMIALLSPRAYDCRTHKCDRPCHPLSDEPSPCPMSPLRITSCPCGKVPLIQEGAEMPSGPSFPQRASCESPIPTCSSPCLKDLPCGHKCQNRCHTGPCYPCNVRITQPCRCGLSAKNMVCSSKTIEAEIVCDRTCTALRACGRHQCNRVCCPMASLAMTKGKGKKRVVADDPDINGMHQCDLICGRPLACRNHTCEERDHRGPCAPCLRSTFEEVSKADLPSETVKLTHH